MKKNLAPVFLLFTLRSFGQEQNRRVEFEIVFE